MSVISRGDLVKKNKEGNGIRNNDVGNNRANNAAISKLADVLLKAAKIVSENDGALELTYNAQGNALKTLATNPINQKTSGQIATALRDLRGFDECMTFKDSVTGRTGYETLVQTLPQLKDPKVTKAEFDDLLRTANGVLELGLEKSILKPIDPREQERQRQEQERIRQEQERQRQEQERIRREQEMLRQEQIRAQNAEKLGVVGAFKADGSTQLTAALLAQKNGAASASKPVDFLNTLKTDAQQRLDRMNRFPESEFNTQERKVVVSVLRNIDYIQQGLRSAPGANASAEEKRRFIEQNAGNTRSLETAYNQYRSIFRNDPQKPAAWPDEKAVAADAKPSLDTLYNEKDMNFVSKFAADQEAVDRQTEAELKALLVEKPVTAGEVVYSFVKVPGKEAPTIEEAYDHLYLPTSDLSPEEREEADPVAMAVDDNGKVYDSREAILKQLSQPGRRLFVFKNDGDLPLVLGNKDGKLVASSEGVSSKMQAPIKSGELFEAKKSLDPRDIADIPSHKAYEKLYEHKKGPSLKVKKAQAWIDEAETKKRKATEWLDEHKKPPKLGAMRTFQRWMYKAITLGFGETSAYKKYRARKDRWIKNVEYNTQQIESMNRRIPAMKAAYAEGKKTIADLEKKIAAADSAYYSKSPSLQKEVVQKYRQNTEVRMEAIADIIKTGKVTQDTVFANTWLAEQNCKGKKIDDPGAVKALISYITSRSVEEKVLEETMKDPEYSRARNSMMVEGLNSGQAADALSRSGIFNKLAAEQGDKPIDPDKFYKSYQQRVSEKEKKFSDLIYKLKVNRQQLINDFGEKPITRDCINDIAKLNVLDNWIERLETNRRRYEEYNRREQELAKTGGSLSTKELDDRQQLEYNWNTYKKDVKEIISDLGLGRKTKTRAANFNQYRTPEYEKALDQVHDNMQNFAVNLEQSGVFDDMTNEQKIRFNGAVDNLKLEGSEVTVDFTKHEKMSESELNDIIEKEKYEGEEKEWNIKYYQEKGNTRTSDPLRTKGNLELSGTQTFRLDKMAEMVNKTVEHNKQAEAEKQAAGPQIQG